MYGENLDRLLETLTHSSIQNLQVAKAIVSISLGFFTHSATLSPDERYLEAIVGIPDIFDEETNFNLLVSQLFSQYGKDLLSVLASDKFITNDAKIAGYGLHFSWRNLIKTPSGPHLTMHEVVIYLTKEQTQLFLSQQLTLDMLLEHATMFSRQGEQPAEQRQYVPPSSPIQPTSIIQLRGQGQSSQTSPLERRSSSE
jgi:hypothetical protein